MIDRSKIIAMVEHWLMTPPNAYYGSSYGADLNGLLLVPLTANVADEFIAKMKADLPILSSLDSDELSLYTTTSGFEKRIIVLSIGTVSIDLTNLQKSSSQSPSSETYDANAV